MFKQQQRRIPLMVSAGLVVGIGLLATGAVLLNRSTPFLPLPGQSPALTRSDSSELGLSNLSAQERISQLTAIAQNSRGLEKSRARYLLATEFLAQRQGNQALAWLNGLETDYPVLAAQILVKRAQSYTSSDQSEPAQKLWQEIWQRYPDNPVAVEALFALGKTQPESWDQAIARFPSHPRTLEIVQTRLQQNPDQPQLLRVLARHAVNRADLLPMLDQWVKRSPSQLQPDDWQAIAFAYWENQDYKQAGKAYAKAPATALHAYRHARGLQLGGQKAEARKAYQQLIQTYPTADETGLGLMRLATLVSPESALTYLDQVIRRFPNRAAEALLAKLELLKQRNSPTDAAQTRKTLLTKYSPTDAAAKLRWQLASQAATAGKLTEARTWAQQIPKLNPESNLAAEAMFWSGKWAKQLGQKQEAKADFKKVLADYPDSYYAWRSAVFLGWEVGDFTTVRAFDPCHGKPCAQFVTRQRLDLPVGSPALQELYQLGQDQDAWDLWQVEFKNPQQPTVAEQFTDGVLRLGVGDRLDGIFMVSFLSQREKPAEQTQYRNLKTQTDYWQALYPTPYLDLVSDWAHQRQLNPLLVLGLIRQESRFEPQIRSSAGAVGLMQVLPETADWIAGRIQLQQFNLNDPRDNIKLGTWYLDYTHDEYRNNSLLAVASYNAGPGNVADWLRRFSFRDPDQFVESIPFDETRGYVKSVFENYWNYLRLYNPDLSRKLAKSSPKHAEIVPRTSS
jgi:soluble lytic murein transglycosylase